MRPGLWLWKGNTWGSSIPTPPAHIHTSDLLLSSLLKVFYLLSFSFFFFNNNGTLQNIELQKKRTMCLEVRVHIVPHTQGQGAGLVERHWVSFPGLWPTQVCSCCSSEPARGVLLASPFPPLRVENPSSPSRPIKVFKELTLVPTGDFPGQSLLQPAGDDTPAQEVTTKRLGYPFQWWLVLSPSPGPSTTLHSQPTGTGVINA